MVKLSKLYDKVIIDMICPTDELRSIINPDVSILMDTISECRFEDTNKIFTKGNPTMLINSFDYDINNIVRLLIKI